MEGIADGSLAPTIAVNRAALFSATTTALSPEEPVAPIDSKSACLKIGGRSVH